MRLPNRKTVNSRRRQLLQQLMLSLSIAAPAALLGSNLTAQEVNTKESSGAAPKVVLPNFPTPSKPSTVDASKSKVDSQTAAAKSPNASTPALAKDTKQPTPVVPASSAPLPLFPTANSSSTNPNSKSVAAPPATSLPKLPQKSEEKKTNSDVTAAKESELNSSLLANLPPAVSSQPKAAMTSSNPSVKSAEEKAPQALATLPAAASAAKESDKSADEGKSVTIKFGGAAEKPKLVSAATVPGQDIAGKSGPSEVASEKSSTTSQSERSSFHLSDKEPVATSNASESSARLSFKDTPAPLPPPTKPQAISPSLESTNSSVLANTAKAPSSASVGKTNSATSLPNSYPENRIATGTSGLPEKVSPVALPEPKKVAGGKVDAFSQERKEAPDASQSELPKPEIVKATPIKPLTISAEGVTPSQPKVSVSHPEAVIIRPKVLVLDTVKSKPAENIATTAPGSEKNSEAVDAKKLPPPGEPTTGDVAKQSVANQSSPLASKGAGELISPVELPKFPSTDSSDRLPQSIASMPPAMAPNLGSAAPKKIDSKVSALPPNMIASQPKEAAINKIPTIPPTSSSITVVEEPKLSAIPLPPPPVPSAVKKPEQDVVVSKESASKGPAPTPGTVETKVANPAMNVASQPMVAGPADSKPLVTVAADPKSETFKLAAARIEPKKYDKPADRTIQVGTIALTTMRIDQHVVEKCEVDDTSICRTLVTADGEVAFLPGKVGVTRARLWIKQPDGKSKIETAEIQVGEVLAEAKPFALEIEQLNERLTALYPGTSLRAEPGDRCIEIRGEAESERQAKEVLQLVRKLCLVPVKDKVSVR